MGTNQIRATKSAMSEWTGLGKHVLFKQGGCHEPALRQQELRRGDESPRRDEYWRQRQRKFNHGKEIR